MISPVLYLLVMKNPRPKALPYVTWWGLKDCMYETDVLVCGEFVIEIDIRFFFFPPVSIGIVIQFSSLIY